MPQYEEIWIEDLQGRPMLLKREVGSAWQPTSKSVDEQQRQHQPHQQEVLQQYAPQQLQTQQIQPPNPELQQILQEPIQQDIESHQPQPEPLMSEWLRYRDSNPRLSEEMRIHQTIVPHTGTRDQRYGSIHRSTKNRKSTIQQVKQYHFEEGSFAQNGRHFDGQYIGSSYVFGLSSYQTRNVDLKR